MIMRAIETIPINGYISMPVLRTLYNVYSWHFMDADIAEAAIKDRRLAAFFSLIPLGSFRETTIGESAVLLYIYIAGKINIRSFEGSKISKGSEKDNKNLLKEDFIDDKLFAVYREQAKDIDERFLLFNDSILTKRESKASMPIRNAGSIVKAVNKYDLVMGTLPYKVLTKSLIIKDTLLESSYNNIVVLQDCTGSMSGHKDLLLSLKAAIINKALISGVHISWSFVSNRVVATDEYAEGAVDNVNRFIIEPDKQLNLTKVLRSGLCKGKKVIIITDGTDDFDFTISSTAEKLNFIYFKQNIKLLNNIIHHGKTFRFK